MVAYPLQALLTRSSSTKPEEVVLRGGKTHPARVEEVQWKEGSCPRKGREGIRGNQGRYPREVVLGNERSCPREGGKLSQDRREVVHSSEGECVARKWETVVACFLAGVSSRTQMVLARKNLEAS